MENKPKMTPIEAWDYFWTHIKPQIWKDLSRVQRDQLFQAHYARQGKKAYPLGVERIKRLLEDYAPGRFGVEETVVFWVVE